VREHPLPGLEAFGSTHEAFKIFFFRKPKSCYQVLPSLILEVLVTVPSTSLKQMPQEGINVGH